MSKNDKAIIERLNEFYNGTDKNITKLSQNSTTKYALFSDLHLGDGKRADNFVHNEKIMIFALNYYKKNGYSLIFLGDLEELWQFDLTRIQNRYDKKIYAIIRSFTDKKVYRVFGNHDIEWKRPSDPIMNDEKMTHKITEAIKLGNDIFLLHGHQGDRICDKYAWFFNLISPVFKFGVPWLRKYFNYENRSATKSQIPKSREKLYYNWAKKKKVILICGHTHNAIFASLSYYLWLKEQIKIKEKKLEEKRYSMEKVEKLSKKIEKMKIELLDEEKKGRNYYRMTAKREEPLPCYFNTGCGLYKKGITNIEIEGDKIRLIKWKKNNSILTERCRKVLWKEKSLSEIREKINIKSIQKSQHVKYDKEPLYQINN